MKLTGRASHGWVTINYRARNMDFKVQVANDHDKQNKYFSKHREVALFHVKCLKLPSTLHSRQLTPAHCRPRPQLHTKGLGYTHLPPPGSPSPCGPRPRTPAGSRCSKLCAGTSSLMHLCSSCCGTVHSGEFTPVPSVNSPMGVLLPIHPPLFQASSSYPPLGMCGTSIYAFPNYPDQSW